ncbi:lyase [Bradyrhizobium japonicum]
MLGRLDPRDGGFKTVSLGQGAAPHGVTIGPDGAPWITEGGQNAIARVDPGDLKITLFRLPEKFAYANLNTGVFDKEGIYWFTGQSGYHGRLKPGSGEMDVFRAPKGVGPYGIAVTPRGRSGTPRWPAAISRRLILRPAMPPLSSRRRRARVRGGSGRIRKAGSGSASGTAVTSRCTIRQWLLENLEAAGRSPSHLCRLCRRQGQGLAHRFLRQCHRPIRSTTERFNVFASDKANANVRQLDGRPGELWGCESGNDRIVMIQTIAAG